MYSMNVKCERGKKIKMYFIRTSRNVQSPCYFAINAKKYVQVPAAVRVQYKHCSVSLIVSFKF